MFQGAQRLEAVPLKDVRIESGFWGERQVTNSARTIPSIYYQMKTAGYLEAWHLTWQPGHPKPRYFHFWDSDTGKWIETAGYSLVSHPNPELEYQVDEIVDLIEKAQQPDSYLNIFFTVYEPHNHWRNLRDIHELYYAGYLMEGAVSYYQATGKRQLLDVPSRYADHIDGTFGLREGYKHGYCGHQTSKLKTRFNTRSLGGTTQGGVYRRQGGV